MIVIEGSHWPLVFVGATDARVAPDDLLIVNERLLELSDALALAVIVPGLGAAAVVAQQAVLDWLRAHRRMLLPRVRRLAWIVEDDVLRACTEAWVSCLGPPLRTRQWATFATVQSATSWLLDTPWPERHVGHDGPVQGLRFWRRRQQPLFPRPAGAEVGASDSGGYTVRPNSPAGG